MKCAAAGQQWLRRVIASDPADHSRGYLAIVNFELEVGPIQKLLWEHR